MNSPLEQAQHFTSLWLDFITRMTSAGINFDSDKPPGDVARANRSAIFKAMGENADQFMRSETFLKMMKQSLDASLNVGKQFNDTMTKAHHSVQSVARQDVDSVLASLHHLETRVLDAIENLNDRLDKLSERIDGLEAHGKDRARDNGHKSVPAGKPAAERIAAAGENPGGSHV